MLAQTSGLLATSKTHGPCQTQNAFVTGSIGGGLRQMAQQGGVLALWKGNTLTCLHRFPFSAINFWVVERCWRWSPEMCRRSRKLLPGAVGGCAAVLVCYPLEVVRTRHMAVVDSRFCLATSMRSLQQEGFAGAYRGIDIALAATVPTISIAFGVYGCLMERYSSVGRPRFWTMFLAGGVSGVVATAMTYPLDVLRRRMQVAGLDPALPKRVCLGEAQHVWRTEGIRGFYRGLTPEIAKVFPSVAITFVAYEWIRSIGR